MGAWKQVLFRMRLIFVGNGSDQTEAAMLPEGNIPLGNTGNIKRHVACRPLLATRFKREVLIEIV